MYRTVILYYYLPQYIIQPIAMMKTYKSTLNLQSYKLDTTSYEQQLKQLHSHNQQLQTTLSTNTYKQAQAYQQLKHLKLEITSLRSIIKNDYLVQESKCNNCKFSKESIRKMTTEIEAVRGECMEYKLMYDNQIVNKKKLAEFYDKKISQLIRDKDILIKKYEEKIHVISSQNSIYSKNVESSTSIKQRLNSPPRNHLAESTLVQESISEKNIKHYPPTPNKSSQKLSFSSHENSGVRSTPVRQLQRNCLNDLVGPIVSRLSKMQITLEQLRQIPQVKKFQESISPAKNRYIKLLRDFPFYCQDEEQIEESYRYIIAYFKQQQINYTGYNFMEVIIEHMHAQQS